METKSPTATTHRHDGTRLATCDCTGLDGRSVQDRTTDDDDTATWTCRCCGAVHTRRVVVTAKRKRQAELIAELVAAARNE